MADNGANGAPVLLAFTGFVVVVLLVLLQLTRLGYLVHTTLPDRPRRRMFLASVSFLITFSGVRILVHRIVSHQGHMHWVTVHGMHIHHLVWGILILLLVGYGWLLEVGSSHTPMSIFIGRLTAVLYGVGAALTLDEFSLWLSLDPESYWTHQGRLSVDAVVIFGATLAVGAWGAPFFRALRTAWGEGAKVGREIEGLSLASRCVQLLRRRKAR